MSGENDQIIQKHQPGQGAVGQKSEQTAPQPVIAVDRAEGNQYEHALANDQADYQQRPEGDSEENDRPDRLPGEPPGFVDDSQRAATQTQGR